jgi:exodeoxyribonuclease III
MPTTITIATFNVNSIKARLSNVLAWLDSCPVDILLLQELKCITENFPTLECEERGYNIAVHGQKTYNGVAILSKLPLDDITTTLPGDAGDEQARYIEAVASVPGAALRVASVYVPNGQEPGSDKFAYKLNFYDRLHRYWRERLALQEMAVLGGDFNCAPFPVDVYDPVKLDGTICYHEAERSAWRRLQHMGLYDAFRVKHPHAQEFSWWDYRAGAFEKNHGLRIDQLMLSPHAMNGLVDCTMDSNPRAADKPSDHIPVIATLLV